MLLMLLPLPASSLLLLAACERGIGVQKVQWLDVPFDRTPRER